MVCDPLCVGVYGMDAVPEVRLAVPTVVVTELNVSENVTLPNGVSAGWVVLETVALIGMLRPATTFDNISVTIVAVSSGMSMISFSIPVLSWYPSTGVSAAVMMWLPAPVRVAGQVTLLVEVAYCNTLLHKVVVVVPNVSVKVTVPFAVMGKTETVKVTLFPLP